MRSENLPERVIPESFKVQIGEGKLPSPNVEIRSASGYDIELRETDEDLFRATEGLGIDLYRWEPAGVDFD